MKTRVPLSSRQSAFSLIIILAVLVLLSGLLIAFLAKSRMELQATVSYSNSIEANEIARGAAEEVAAGLGIEAALAITDTTPALEMVRIGSTSTDARVSNLIRRSIGDEAIFNAGYDGRGQKRAKLLASNFSTTVASLNGRKISTDRWSAPMLLSSTLTVAPDWVIVTREGSAPKVKADVPDLLNLESGTNMRAALGRYAYMLYDIGGLLDANLAGTPSTDADPRRSQKGSEAAIELTPVFATGSATPEAFLNWRQGSLARVFGVDPSVAAIPVTSGSSGELEIGSRAQQATGNRFTSRQDMLRFMKTYQSGTAFPPVLAPYFTTYSIASNAPEIPQCLATGTYASFTYTGTGDFVSIPRYRVEDGVNEPYNVAKGSSLLARKFPLSRLRWFSQHDSGKIAPAAAYVAAIKQHFGLTWVEHLNSAGLTAPEYQQTADSQAPGGFVYTSPDAGAGSSTPAGYIKTLAEVAALPTKREPDFFEWLKSAIGNGSLGVTAGVTSFYWSSSTSAQELSKDFQIIQIGTNIIDQVDADDVPSLIVSTSGTSPTGITPAFDRRGKPLVAFGVENLPYINDLTCSVCRVGSTMQAWLQPEIWAPHANVGSAATRRDMAGNEINQFQIRIVEGSAVIDSNLLLRAGDGSKKGTPTYTSNKNISATANMSRQRRGTANKTTFTGNAATDKLIFSVSSNDYLEPTLVNAAGNGNAFNWGNLRTLKPGAAPWEAAGDFASKYGISLGTQFLPDSAVVEGIRFDIDEIVAAETDPLYKDVVRDKFKDPTYPPEDPALQGQYTWPIGKKMYNQVLVGFNNPAVNSDTYTPVGSPGTIVLEAKINGSWIPYQTFEQLQGFQAIQVEPASDPIAFVNGKSFADPVYSKKYTQEYGMLFQGTGPPGHPEYAMSWCRPLPAETATYIPTTNTSQGPFFYGWNMVRARNSLAKVDPRTRRFGPSLTLGGSPGVGIRDTSDAWDNAVSASNWDVRDVAVPGVARGLNSITSVFNPSVTLANWKLSHGTSTPYDYYLPLADLGRNLDAGTGNSSSYKDTDGITRPADFAYVPDANFPTIPVATAKKRARPVILNRPFRDVAELGYAFRDTPWKTLDMINDQSLSGDLGLLNVFCIEDNELVSGRINPSIAKPEVLQGIFQGTLKNSSANASEFLAPASMMVVGETDAKNAASNLIQQFANPAVTTKDVVSMLNQVSPVKLSVSQFKTEGEAYARALTGVSNRRTWTLLIDIIAQAGRYPRSAKELSDFVVSGERRYWVYITLDRYTGKVLRMEYEPVYE